MARRCFFLLAAMLLWLLPTHHAVAQDAPATGHLELTFTERHPDSAIERLLVRFQYRGDPNEAIDPRAHADEYDLDEQTFRVYVPDAYDGSEPYGLLVWVSATDEGEVPWRDVFDNRRLIVVSADGVGDRQNVWKRMGLQLDAVHNMTARYHIDPMRVYISGCSKGGRIASQLGLVFADVFDGAMPMDGCDWYQQLTVPGTGGRAYRARFNRPTARLLRHAQRRNRYVLMTGELDENRDQTKFFFERGYQRAGFEHVWYLEEPGATHCRHTPEFVERGLALLDQPLEDGTLGPEDDEEDTRPRRTPREPPAAPTAAQLLNLARNYLDAGLTEQAREKLEALLDTYPDSDEAGEAQQLLDSM
jgi:hypothetical protein